MAYCSFISAPGTVLASRVELRPWENPDLLAEMASIMQDQATRIQESEQNLERVLDAKDER